jgi:Tfp pilus assembly PilM family ATPase
MSPLSRRKKWSVFIDLGHSKSRLVAISPDFSEMRFYQVPAAGLAKGKILDRDAFTDSLRQLTEVSGINGLSYTASVNVPSNQTRTVVQTVNYRLNGSYRARDYESIIEGSFESTFGGLDEVIDVLMLQLKVDGNIVDPLRFTAPGSEASARLLLAIHPSVLLSDILACVNAAGIEVSEFRSNSFGVARALTYLRGASENAVLLDFGHATITGALMVGGVVNQIFCVPAGSGHITRDLAAGLCIDQLEAETLKTQLGILDKSSGAGAKLSHYALPRVSELMGLACKNFSIYSRSLDGGLLFCGGGAALAGLSEYTSQKFGIRPPFIAQLSNTGARTFIGINPISPLAIAPCDPDEVKVDSGWISLLSHVRASALFHKASLDEKNSRPLSRLNPLWTWLSELSR